jgi:hypothetical protein
VNFLTDPQEGRPTLRLADVTVYGWVGGKHAYVDLTGVSPLVGLRIELRVKEMEVQGLNPSKRRKN